MSYPLQLSSGYRSAGYQAQLCRRISGPCAPPGRSMHQYGLAIDTESYRAVAAVVNANPSIGLCQPLPSIDAVPFSHVTGSECAGSTGTLGPGGLFGGDLSGFAVFDVRLVE
ncbi:MAG: M15 family metallopeptidase [Egibacteraceae bacterium]